MDCEILLSDADSNGFSSDQCVRVEECYPITTVATELSTQLTESISHNIDIENELIQPEQWHHISLTDHVNNNHTIGGQLSQMNIVGWRHELRYETDIWLKNYLLGGVTNGFHILDHDADVPPYQCYNYSSVLQGEAHRTVDKLILKEIEEGKYILSECGPHNVHALGAVPKTDMVGSTKTCQ